MRGCCLKVAVLVYFALAHAFNAVAVEQQGSIEALLSESVEYLGSTPEKAALPLEKLKGLQSGFSPTQSERYRLLFASFLAFKGRHQERVALVQEILPLVKEPAQRAKFLYQLIDGYNALGEYELALSAMNEAILLLPKLQGDLEKITVLQGALVVSSSFHAYDDALDYADRIYSLRGDTVGSLAECLGLTDKMEVNFQRGNQQLAQSLAQNALSVCKSSKNLFFALIIKTDLAIGSIDSKQYSAGIEAGVPLLRQFYVLNRDSEYVTQLEEALARAYLKTGNTERAEYFGSRADQRAQLGKILELQEKTSETMATIKRAKGELNSALNYYDINLALKKKVLDDQMHKNLAYQRAKFDSQDKANQMALLAQKNKNLSIEKALQHGKYQNLILLMTLVLVLLVILGAWLVNTLRLKNFFRKSSQIDGLTQVSNRAHFTTCAHQVFANAKREASVILFDMDFFKKINDTYGHAAGDWVLRTVCATVKNQLQKNDCFGRLGGEEFALCLEGVTSEKAVNLAERCRASIAAIDTQPCGFDFSITASFGVATHDTSQWASFEETLVAADKALYLSKSEGRNRVTVYQHTII
ncbi:MAG: GGDEF domain-containing protein [Rhodoferax sp.]